MQRAVSDSRKVRRVQYLLLSGSTAAYPLAAAQRDACSQLQPAAQRSQILPPEQGDVAIRLLLLQLQEAVGARHCKGWEAAGGAGSVGLPTATHRAHRPGSL